MPHQYMRVTSQGAPLGDLPLTAYHSICDEVRKDRQLYVRQVLNLGQVLLGVAQRLLWQVPFVTFWLLAATMLAWPDELLVLFSGLGGDAGKWHHAVAFSLQAALSLALVGQLVFYALVGKVPGYINVFEAERHRRICRWMQTSVDTPLDLWLEKPVMPDSEDDSVQP